MGGDQIVRGGLPTLTTRGHSEEIWDENPPDTKPASAQISDLQPPEVGEINLLFLGHPAYGIL